MNEKMIEIYTKNSSKLGKREFRGEITSILEALVDNALDGGEAYREKFNQEFDIFYYEAKLHILLTEARRRFDKNKN